jgi:hypothetical protein
LNLRRERNTQPDRLAQQSAIEREHHRPPWIDHRRAQQDGIHPADSLACNRMALNQRFDIALRRAVNTWQQADLRKDLLSILTATKHDLTQHIGVHQYSLLSAQPGEHVHLLTDVLYPDTGVDEDQSRLL